MMLRILAASAPDASSSSCSPGWVSSRPSGTPRSATSGSPGNHTTWLGLLFLAVAAVLVVRFVRTGSAKRKLTTPPKLMPPFHTTPASGMLPTEQTDDSIATSGPTSGSQNA